MMNKEILLLRSEYNKIRKQFQVLKDVRNKELMFGLSDFIFKKGHANEQIIEKITNNFYIKTTRLEFLKRMLMRVEILNKNLEEFSRINRKRIL